MGRMFENRKQSMFARWDRMAKAFTRIGKDIAIAVKAGGPNPDGNPALRRAIQNARAANMPKDKVENAIKRAQGNDATDYAELVYEGYGPHGVAMLVEAATDNPTRTIANIRMHFNKLGGNLGTSGSVGFLFKRQAVFKVKAEGVDRDALELDLIDHGLEELEDGGEDHPGLLVIRCPFNDFGRLQGAIEARGVAIVSAEAEYTPLTYAELGPTEVEDVLKLVDRLEQDDDVQKVFHTLS
ncbi:MAG: YebC/PmpR family DNA-binding transcriptional regulator [Deltaproteobacteria bacterium]|nr:YebC/PmpR family DNA-binding transcriptional regulator [Deltaproteobacteria bacterium]